ncbi:DUF4234 domain-containing protein [Enterococcus cecorum]|uniref:DUF4234 domain-containing protein n=1 Tax=Enterococcus cecorum TaxID=44008 RepID=UPI001FADAE5C|nr:DUF4234 domain-containing protein [Enterococcus cecorum]MCJ0555015.1 DUF4234 domain-containing protein [Enterococcus cecorum]
MKVTKRNFVVSILLSLVTCGIYSLYWMVMLNDEIHNIYESMYPEDLGTTRVSGALLLVCLRDTSPSPRDNSGARKRSSARNIKCLTATRHNIKTGFY